MDQVRFKLRLLIVGYNNLMTDIKFHKLSWMDYYRDSVDLYKKKVRPTLKKNKIDYVVSITRGGGVIARIYSDLLGIIPISHITLTSYKDMKKLRKPIITEEPARDFKGKSIIIVDEVSDSGATFEIVVPYFKKKGAKKIYTLSPYIKPHTTFIPDFWYKSINAWIVFPHDVRETYEGFIKLLGSPKHAQEKMLEIGFEQWEIDAVIL